MRRAGFNACVAFAHPSFRGERCGLGEMDGGGREREALIAPLLPGAAAQSAAPARQKSSVRFLKREFLSRLPAKVRSAVDAEDPSRIDISRTKALSAGRSTFPSSPPPPLD